MAAAAVYQQQQQQQQQQSQQLVNGSTSTESDLQQYLSRPVLGRRQTENTFIADEASLFDAASTLYLRERKVMDRFFIQARCPTWVTKKGIKAYRNWVLCYVTIISIGNGDEVFAHLLPSDEARDKVTAPRVLLHLQGSALRSARSKLFIGTCNVQAVARSFNRKGTLEDPTPLESWEFAGFGLASSLDKQTMGFVKAVCDATGWQAFDRKGALMDLA